jgi:hypothetical protein
MATRLIDLIRDPSIMARWQGGNPWDGTHPEELIEIDGRLFTEYEFFEVLGELVERHPIPSAGIRRS